MYEKTSKNDCIFIMAKSLPLPEYIVRSDKGEITTVAFGKFTDDDNPYLLTGHNEGDIQIWSLKTYRPSKSWAAHPGQRVQWVTWIPERCVISYGRDGFVKFWKFGEGRTPECIDTLSSTCFSHCLCAVVAYDAHVPKDTFYLGIPQETASVDVVNVCDRKPFYKIKETNSIVKLGTLMCFEFITTDGDLLVVGGYECGSVVLWSGHYSQPLCKLDLYDDPVMCIDYDKEFMCGIVGSSSEKLITWSICASEQATELRVEKTALMLNRGATSIKIHPKSLYVAVSGWDNTLRIYSWRKMKPLAAIKIHSDSIQSLAYGFTSSGVILAAGSKDGRASLWNLYNK